MRLEFDDLMFDTEARELLRHGTPVPLSPKAFELLSALIENRPKALAKSVLHDLLWPDTFVVDANLSNLIGEIRRALGDDAQRPRYIRTIHRVGYAFHGHTADSDGRAQKSPVCRLTWAGGTATLREGDHVIGRDSEATVLLDSPSVSRRHARIRIVGGHAVFEDLGSKNGSSVAGRRTTGPVGLADGDVIIVGVVELTFRLVRPAVPTESVL